MPPRLIEYLNLLLNGTTHPEFTFMEKNRLKLDLDNEIDQNSNEAKMILGFFILGRGLSLRIFLDIAQAGLGV